MDYKEAIKKLRFLLLMTQKEFGDLLGVALATVNRWESGKYEPTMKIKRVLASYFSEYNIEVTINGQ